MLSGLSVWGDEIVEKKLIKVFILKYHDKIASLDSEKLEDPEFVNYLNRCEKGIALKRIEKNLHSPCSTDI